MRETFEVAEERLLAERPKLDIVSRVRINKNGTVTGEMRVRVPRNIKPYDMTLMIEEAVGNAPQGHWINVGVRFPINPNSKADYPKRGGVASVSAHYQPEYPQAAFLAVRAIMTNLRNRRRARVEEIIVRLQWNSQNIQPKRAF